MVTSLRLQLGRAVTLSWHQLLTAYVDQVDLHPKVRLKVAGKDGEQEQTGELRHWLTVAGYSLRATEIHRDDSGRATGVTVQVGLP